MQLYYSPNSPYARKVRVMLAEKDIDCDQIQIDVSDAPPEFERRNPNLRVPCLVDGEQAVFESNVILSYLLQQYPQHTGREVPALATAMTRPQHHWDDLLVLETIETLMDSCRTIYQLGRGGIAVDQAPYLLRDARRIQTDLDWLESRFAADGYVPGIFSIQDLNLAIVLLWMEFRDVEKWRGRPHLESLVARYGDRPSFQATRPVG